MTCFKERMGRSAFRDPLTFAVRIVFLSLYRDSHICHYQLVYFDDKIILGKLEKWNTDE